ncbi:MAG TPA: sugar ABC transporter ATP-binding protein, partial [Kofleriaceae bacterium]|nr:sugar ABC transporter ATP-binding protein [Kofleriaceae bacterium]
MIELRHIGKAFPGVRALSDVSLEIRDGEVLGLVGENGAGKSTLIKILAGVYADYEGEVVVDGEVHAFRSTADAREAGIGVVHQELSLIPDMTVADNLLLRREPSRFGVLDVAMLEARAGEILRAVTGENIPLDVAAGSLGIGVQQMIEIARAVGDGGNVIVLDEPTAALTGEEVDDLFAVIRGRKADGTSFVYISHRLDEIAALCDRVAVLRDGELVGVVPGNALSDDIVAMMTGKELGDVHAPIGRAEPGAPVLEVCHLRVEHPTLPGRAVVDDLSFDVHAGEVVALAGAMGSGRTATLSALFGIARAGASGTVTVDGRRVSMTSPRDAIAAGIAFVPEDRKAAGLVLQLSVTDNLALSALSRYSRLGIVDAARVERSALARLRDLSIKAPGLGAEVATLSGGNQQKVVIGKWLELAPRVLLL